MSLIAYDFGLVNGVENSAASLAVIALEVHLKTLLGDLLSLIRSDRSESCPVASTSQLAPERGTPPPASSSLRLRDLKTQGLAPHLTAKDFAGLAEISPHAFVRCHPGALERLVATHSFAEPVSSDEEDRPIGPSTTARLPSFSPRSSKKLASRSHLGLKPPIRPMWSTPSAPLPPPPPPPPDKVANNKSLAAELFPEHQDEPQTQQQAGSESETEGVIQKVASGLGGSAAPLKRKGWDRIDTFRLLENVGT